jgi:hypothetical protein
MAQMEQQFDATYLRPGIFQRAAAVGIAAAGVGTGILLAAWGISFLWRYTPPKIEIANPELRIIQEEPFKVEQGQPFKVEQDNPFKVEQEKPFNIDKSSLSAIEGNDNGSKTASGDVIRYQVTTFSEVDHESGQVLTGWIYKDGSGGIPVHQYCYYLAPNGDGSTKKVDIASDGVPLSPIRTSLVPNLDAALAKCQWWRR